MGVVVGCEGALRGSERSLKVFAGWGVAVLKLSAPAGRPVSDPISAVADSLQALRNGATDEQWDGLKANPLVRDLISRCADLEAAWLLSDKVVEEGAGTPRGKGLRSSVDAHLLLVA